MSPEQFLAALVFSVLGLLLIVKKTIMVVRPIVNSNLSFVVSMIKNVWQRILTPFFIEKRDHIAKTKKNQEILFHLKLGHCHQKHS